MPRIGSCSTTMPLRRSCAPAACRFQLLFFIGYVAGLALLFGAIVAIGRAMYQTWLGVAMLAALMTLRHRITQTGANSLESYFQPRMIAFALGAWAIAAFLRGSAAAPLALVARGVCHSPNDGDVVRDLAGCGHCCVGARLACSARRARGCWRGPCRMGGDARPAAWPSGFRWIRFGLLRWPARTTFSLLTGTRRSGSST